MNQSQERVGQVSKRLKQARRPTNDAYRCEINSGVSPMEADRVSNADTHEWARLFADSVARAGRPTLCLALDNTLAWANDAFCELVGVAMPALASLPLDHVAEPETVAVFATWCAQAAAGTATSWDADIVLRRTDGVRLVMNVSLVVLLRGRRPAYLFGGMHDVTHQRRAADLLVRQTESLERIARGDSLSTVLTEIAVSVEIAHPGVRCTILLLDDHDAGRLYTAAAPSMPAAFAEAIDGSQIGPHEGSCGVAAFRAAEVVSTDLAHDPDWAAWRDVALALNLRACWSVPIIASGRHGDEGRVLGTFATYFDTPRAPADEERREISRAAALAMIALERDRDEAELRYANLRDPMTGLGNRRLFLDELGNALRRARRSQSTVAVLFLDVDHFKLLNDSMGHLLGDEVLRTVAGRVHDATRPHDIVSRFGGDEFTVFCENVVGPSEAEEIAHRLRDSIEKPIQLSNGDEIFLTVSIGIALGSALTAPHELVADADAAMHQAKATGRSGVIRFDERMRARSRDRLHIQSALRRAIDRHELDLVYQPQIDLTTGAMVSVEALLRWTSGELGVVPPDRFVPIAEDSDLIMDIGAWVLERACEQASKWDRADQKPLLVAVNASARQFAHGDVFFDTIAGVLASTGLHPSQLRIEVTESTLGNPVTVGPLVAELKHLGVSLAIDDFGTGFSSLARLRSFYVDELKIDRSFVEGLENHADDRAVVAAIIGMARALHVDTVGEGVETPGQLEILRKLGCDRAQGFHLGRPMPASDITALLDARD